MIFETIILFFINVVNFFVKGIPTVSLPREMLTGLESATVYFGYIDSFIPLSILTLCIGSVIVVYNFNFFVRIIRTVWDLIPFT